MYYNRPSFKRGGPTGIAQLTPNRQRYVGGGNIGGGSMSGINMGSRTGFQNPMINFLNNNILGTRTQIPTMSSEPISMTQAPITGIEQILSGTDTRGSVNTTPQTVEGLYKKRAETAKRIGEVLSTKTFVDSQGVERDRTTGKVITDTITSSGIGEILNSGDPTQFTGEDELTDFEAIKQAEIEANKATEKANMIEPGSDDNSITLDPYEEIKKEKDFLSKMLKNEGLERGEIALIAAKAIGTEGSFKDKLDAAVDLALPVVRARNKEDKALTLTAYKLFKEKEKAQAKAGEDTTGIKDLKYQASILMKSDKYKGKSRDDVIADIVEQKFTNSDSDATKKYLRNSQVAGQVFEYFDDVKDSKEAVDMYVKKKYTDKDKEIDTTDKKLIRLQKELSKAAANFNLFAKEDEFKDVYGEMFKQFTALNLAEGGRVKRALGTPDTGSGEQIITTEAKTIGAETAEKPVIKLDYAQLRNRLPAEITDDVVQLLANSEEALQEFAYIQTQNDVDAFNLKYGVNLIIPPTPQTA